MKVVILAIVAFAASVSAAPAPGYLGGPVYAPAFYAAPVIKHVHPVHAVYSPPIIHAAPIIHKHVYSAPIVKHFGYGPFGYDYGHYGHFGHHHGHHDHFHF